MKITVTQFFGLMTARNDFLTDARMASIGHDKSNDRDYDPDQADIDRLGAYLDQTYGQIGTDRLMLTDIFGLEQGKTAEQVRADYMRDAYARHAEACEIVNKLAGQLGLSQARSWRDL